MSVVGEKKKKNIRPAFDKSIHIDFKGATITSEIGFLILRELDERPGLLEQTASGIEYPRSASHTDHSFNSCARDLPGGGGL
jgi:hypothetical protein